MDDPGPLAADQNLNTRGIKGMQTSAAHAQRLKEVARANPITDITKPDAYEAILGSSLPAEDKRVNRIAQEVLTLLVGGSSSTSRVMTRLIYHLASEPKMLARLREELRTVIQENSVVPDLADLESLEYLVNPHPTQPKTTPGMMSSEKSISLHLPLVNILVPHLPLTNYPSNRQPLSKRPFVSLEPCVPASL